MNNFEFSRKSKTLTAIALMASALALSACAGKSSAADIDSMSASQRFDYDFAGGNDDKLIQDSYYQMCLRSTPYDPTARGKTASTITLNQENQILVTPANSDGQVLTLANNGPGETLAAVNPETAKVFEAYGCATGVYK